MMPGPMPKPIEVKRAEGNPGKRRLPTPTVVKGRAPLKPPRGLPRPVAAAFRELARNGRAILDEGDAPIVEAAAVALLRARQATADVEKRGMLVEIRRVGRDGSELIRDEANPSIAIERSAWAEFRLLTDRLGIGPAARARLAGLGVEGKQAAEAFDELAEMRAARAAG